MGQDEDDDAPEQVTSEELLRLWNHATPERRSRAWHHLILLGRAPWPEAPAFLPPVSRRAPMPWRGARPPK